MVKTTAFIPVFEEKLDKLKKDLKLELGKAKTDRRKLKMIASAAPIVGSKSKKNPKKLKVL